MPKKVLFFVCVLQALMAAGQDCPVLTSPVNGAVDVPVDTTISWTEADPSVPGYIISIGTTPGGTDIIDQRSLGRANNYIPPLGLPENTEIFVTITLFFFNQPNITCASESFRTVDVTTAPSCSVLRNPIDGGTNVNTGTNIAWNYAPTATGYRLSIGTTPGGVDLLNDQDLGNTLFYNPPVEFPPSTPIFVRVVPYNENGSAMPCSEESFTTGVVATLPSCATMVSPANGEVNVSLTPILEWTPVVGATGYRVTIGNTPFTAEVVDNGIFPTNSTLVIDFEPNRTFFITIIPFNDAGDAIGCAQESFSTLLGCGPYLDVVTGEITTLNPEINFPDTISFCENSAPFTTSASDTADGFRWFKIDQFGNETLISDTADVTIMETGEYRYEAYNTVAQTGGTIECPTSKIFEVLSSEVATITDINITEGATGLRVEVLASGIGDYEYALDDTNGPYQDSRVFTNITPGSHTVYVRDKNGCGIVQQQIEQDITVEGFPKFFTPNGDGINDYWQFIPPPLAGGNTVSVIHIFDRFGNLLVQLDPISLGWDGNFNGQPLPSSDYWYSARDNLNNEIRGHFALKR
ncbi:T9SS type B sorting domain-containing protein [Muriicola sp. Z0-33]|uniref:T9SS type B sorting domain-containing protein n=1 Tax=Muriicola sp. Z0-33 TaxID=2816957 RepID=UPI002238329A|nr:T9SS type B sorting domain-containing protein [Muriicola sp. Z0-33]MCW5515970.1 T9SS type B sorting domain-containing protein [Muriicola sp. Z0-33]